MNHTAETMSVQTETVTCSACGAPLSIPDNVEYVGCRFCQTQLHVQRNQSVVFTEVLQSLHRQTERLADNTEIIRLQQNIEFLDKEWKDESAEFTTTDSQGRTVFPDKDLVAIEGKMMVAAAVIGTVAVFFFYPLLSFVGLVCIVAVVGNNKLRQEKLARFEGKQAAYQQKRNDLLDQLRQIEPRN